jgi:hypothetical protein
VQGVQLGAVHSWCVGDVVIACSTGCWQEVVIGVYTPIHLVVVMLGLVYELPELAYPIGPVFEPLVLVCFVSFMCKPSCLHPFPSVCLSLLILSFS